MSHTLVRMSECATGEQGVGSTRERIVECARQLFSQNSFSAVSIRDIADAAGVSPSLVVKHCTSKERLFELTLDFSDSARALFAGPFNQLGRTAARETLLAPVDSPYSMVRILTVAGGSDSTLQAMGRRVEEDILSVVAERISAEAPGASPSPRLRAQQVVALLTGLSFMRRVGDPGFDAYEREELVDHYGSALQRLLDGC